MLLSSSSPVSTRRTCIRRPRPGNSSPAPIISWTGSGEQNRRLVPMSILGQSIQRGFHVWFSHADIIQQIGTARSLLCRHSGRRAVSAAPPLGSAGASPRPLWLSRQHAEAPRLDRPIWIAPSGSPRLDRRHGMASSNDDAGWRSPPARVSSPPGTEPYQSEALGASRTAAAGPLMNA
jgi:hypothetical protein